MLNPKLNKNARYLVYTALKSKKGMGLYVLEHCTIYCGVDTPVPNSVVGFSCSRSVVGLFQLCGHAVPGLWLYKIKTTSLGKIFMS